MASLRVPLASSQQLHNFLEMSLSIHAIYTVKDTVRKEMQLFAQNCYLKESGVFTGEIRSSYRHSYFSRILPTSSSQLSAAR